MRFWRKSSRSRSLLTDLHSDYYVMTAPPYLLVDQLSRRNNAYDYPPPHPPHTTQRHANEPIPNRLHGSNSKSHLTQRDKKKTGSELTYTKMSWKSRWHIWMQTTSHLHWVCLGIFSEETRRLWKLTGRKKIITIIRTNKTKGSYYN